MSAKLGRPRLSKAKAKGVLIGARFSPEEARRVNSAANQFEKGKSEWIRKTLISAASNDRDMS
jgi:hypothetical protein